MNVLFVTNMYPREQGSYYGIFIQELQVSLEHLGVSIDVVFTDGASSVSSYFTTIPALARRLRATYDLVHAHHTYCLAQAVVARFASGRRPPLLLSFHEGEVFAPRDIRHERRRVLRSLVGGIRFKRWAAGRADGLIAVEDRLRAALGYGGPWWVIPPGVDTELFFPRDRAESRRRLGLDDDATIAFFPARPTHAKGFDLFEEAVALLAQRVEPLVGGAIPRDEMPIYMAASDVVVAPSRFEASPMVVKEAMAMDRPVVSTGVGDVEELFAGVSGFELCATSPASVAEALGRALATREPAGRARVLAQGLTLQDVARRHLAVYEALVA